MELDLISDLILYIALCFLNHILKLFSHLMFNIDFSEIYFLICIGIIQS